MPTIGMAFSKGQARPLAACIPPVENGRENPLGCVSCRKAKGHAVVELLKSNDLVLISYVMHLLAEEGIEAMVFDEHMSAVEGSIGALPRRIMIGRDDLDRSRDLLGKNVLTNIG
jgi:hypothetical protein